MRTNEYKKACIIVVCVTVCFGSFFLYLSKSNKDLSANFEDTGAYLEGALIIKESGGIGNFFQNCMNGAYRISEQHPLYLLALAPFASRDLAFFPKAKLITIVFAVIAINILFLISYHHLGKIYAMLALLLIMFNSSFSERATHVTVETLLICLTTVSWFLLYKGYALPKLWAIAGVCSGLAFATKGTGLVMLFTFVLSGILLDGINVLKKKWFWIFCVLFFAINFPYLARNIIVFKTPLYEGINSHIFWLDNWSQISLPQYNLTLNWADHTYTWEKLPTIYTYIKEHSIYDIIKRISLGTINEINLLRKAMYINGFPANEVLSYIILIIAFAEIILDNNRSRRIYTGIIIVAFILPFGWFYQVIPKDRYIAPLIPIIIFYFVSGLKRAIDMALKWKRINSEINSSSYENAILAGLTSLIIFGQIYFLYVNRNQPLLHPMALAADQEDLFSWIRSKTSHKSTLLLGPTNRYWGYLWYANYKGKIITNAGNSQIFKNSTIDDFTNFLINRSVSHIVIHIENYMSPTALLDYFEISQDKVLGCKVTPALWKQYYRFSDQKYAFYIFGTE